MTDCLSQQQIAEITGYQRPHAQERKLRELDYIVIGRDAKGRVKALAAHPDDPALKAANDRGDTVRLHLATQEA